MNPKIGSCVLELKEIFSEKTGNTSGKQFEILSARMRLASILMSHKSGSAHLGSALSCIDLIVALYFQIMDISVDNFSNPERDRFILSKGHAATALYSVLAEKGLLSVESLENFGNRFSLLEEHPTPKIDGVEAATGSLGHGLPIALGMSLGARLKGYKSKTFVVMSDGECNEGAVWEAALFAAAQKLNNLCVIIDFNKWQATGRSADVLALEPLAEKWRAFGWDVAEIDGHNFEQILFELNKVNSSNQKPIAIVAHTIKGKGVSFMEDDNNWHYRSPDKDEVEMAAIELGLL